MKTDDERAIQDRLNEILEEYLGDEDGALELLDILGEISQTFDDLADGDKPVTYQDLLSLIDAVLFRKDRNPFYQRNFASMQWFMEYAFVSWRTANDIEWAPDPTRMLQAYTIRSAITPIIVHMITLSKGQAAAVEAYKRIMPLVYSQEFRDYLAEFTVGGTGVSDGVQEQEGEA